MYMMLLLLQPADLMAQARRFCRAGLCKRRRVAPSTSKQSRSFGRLLVDLETEVRRC